MAREEADVERFLKSGIFERILLEDEDEGDDGGVYEVVDDGEVESSELGGDDGSDMSNSDPNCTSAGPSPRLISPKCCSVSLTASSCFTPTNATTIRSGL